MRQSILIIVFTFVFDFCFAQSNVSNIFTLTVEPERPDVSIPTPVVPPVSKPHTNPDVDIDNNIPVTNYQNKNTFVLIIANENYDDKVGNVPFALNDGEVFKKYCIRLLGIPEKNVKMLPNATKNHIDDGIEWLTNIAAHSKNLLRYIVYYSGHGVPNEEETFLLPTDANPEKPNQMIALNNMYQRLSEIPSQSVICLLDACFSGTKRSGKALTQGGRGAMLVARPKKPIHGNLLVLSAADATQTAYPIEEQRHGMFTYFLLKSLQNSKGILTVEKLFEEVYDNVAFESSVANRTQTPCKQVSDDLGDQWKKWTLK